MSQEQTAALQFIPKVRQEEFDAVLINYQHYIKGHLWVRIPAFLMVTAIAGYNFLFAGKSYSINEANNIKSTMIVILSFVVLALIIGAILLFKRQGTLKKKVKGIALKYGFAYKEFKKEVNLVLKSHYGGNGI
ncbi:hypothetical protein [Algoriphagus resistens]|uniref:hypothetical protein n=1 Tax=Algoriphagus resistens TaxID=1750590 RepID=UPI0007168445|nr:hypothetical protein [Algoriphagus resistens]